MAIEADIARVGEETGGFTLTPTGNAPGQVELLVLQHCMEEEAMAPREMLDQLHNLFTLVVCKVESLICCIDGCRGHL